MKTYLFIISACLMLVIAACSKKNHVESQTCTGPEMQLATLPLADSYKPARFSEATIKGDCLQMMVLESSACDGNTWKLKVITSGSDITGSTVRMRIFIENKENCQAAISKEFYVDLKKFRQPGISKRKIWIEGMQQELEYSW